jgi:hypothetical protein
LESRELESRKGKERMGVLCGLLIFERFVFEMELERVKKSNEMEWWKIFGLEMGGLSAWMLGKGERIANEWGMDWEIKVVVLCRL